MLDRLKAMKNEQDNFHVDFLEYVKDKTISLEDRWVVFKFAVDNDLFVNIMSYYWSSPTMDRLGFDSPYDDFGIDRYATLTFTDMIERMSSNYSRHKDKNISKKDFDSVKEEILQTGYSGYNFDW